MIEFEKLKKLEKQVDINLRYCKIIAVNTFDNENGCYTKRIAKADNRYYMHIMHNGNVIQCFEIALNRKPFDNVFVFAFTPDDVHQYEIDVRGAENARPDDMIINDYDIISIDMSRLENGMQCKYNNITVELVNDDFIAVNGNNIKVETVSDYTYKLLKTKIKAVDGAKGLFKFLDNIAENGKFDKYPLFYQVFNQIAEKYA